MNRISLDHALLELQDMFPQYDREMLEEVIREHHGKMEEIITFLLILNGDETPVQQLTYKEACGSGSSSQTQKEIRHIEEEFGLNLHKQWNVRLPHDLLVFEVPETEDDEELARRLQNEFDEQASQNLLMSAVTDNQYYASPQRYGYGTFQNQPRGPSVGKTIAEKSKKLKNKFMNFWYERKGYKRVNVNDGSENSTRGL